MNNVSICVHVTYRMSVHVCVYVLVRVHVCGVHAQYFINILYMHFAGV